VPLANYNALARSAISRDEKADTAKLLTELIQKYPSAGLDLVQTLVLFKMSRKSGDETAQSTNLKTLQMRVQRASASVHGELEVPTYEALMALVRNVGVFKATLPSTFKRILTDLSPEERLKLVGPVGAPLSANIRTFLDKNGITIPKAGSANAAAVRGAVVLAKPPTVDQLIDDAPGPGVSQDDVQRALDELSPMEAERLAFKWRPMLPAEQKVAVVKKTYNLPETKTEVTKQEIAGHEFYAIKDALQTVWLFPKHTDGAVEGKQTTVLLSAVGSTADVKTQAGRFYVKKFFREPLPEATVKKLIRILVRLLSYASSLRRSGARWDFMDRICPVLMLSDDKGFMPFHKHDSIKTICEKLRPGGRASGTLQDGTRKLDLELLARAYKTLLEDYEVMLKAGISGQKYDASDAFADSSGGHDPWAEMHADNLLLDLDEGRIILLDLDAYSLKNEATPFKTFPVSPADRAALVEKANGHFKSLCDASGLEFAAMLAKAK
jgi:hypothetical protein